MIWAIDSSALALLINPAANPPIDPATDAPVLHASQRVEHFIRTLTAADRLIVPTPVLAEVLVKAGASAPAVLEELTGRSRIRVKAFDLLAAVELAAMTETALAAGNKKGASTAPWQKVKFDRQIIAVARVARATGIYTDDANLAATARELGMQVVSTWEMSLPEQINDLLSPLADQGLAGGLRSEPGVHVTGDIIFSAGPETGQ